MHKMTKTLSEYIIAAYLPPGSRENVFVTLVVASFDDLPCMGFVLFNRGVGKQTDVIVNIKVEQRTGLPASLVDYEIIEGIVLQWGSIEQGLVTTT